MAAGYQPHQEPSIIKYGVPRSRTITTGRMPASEITPGLIISSARSSVSHNGVDTCCNSRFAAKCSIRRACDQSPGNPRLLVVKRTICDRFRTPIFPGRWNDRCLRRVLARSLERNAWRAIAHATMSQDPRRHFGCLCGNGIRPGECPGPRAGPGCPGQARAGSGTAGPEGRGVSA